MKHSVKNLIGFTIGAGRIGKAKEFYFDDEFWVVRNLILDTGNWLWLSSSHFYASHRSR